MPENHDETVVDDANNLEGCMSEQLDSDDLQHLEYITKDPVRRFQFDYDKSVCLIDKFPDVNLKESQQNDKQRIQI